MSPSCSIAFLFFDKVKVLVSIFDFFNFHSMVRIIMSTPLRFFHTGISRYSSTEVWVTASLCKSPGLFSVFWLILIVLSFEWSPLVLLFPSPPVPLSFLWGLYQAPLTIGITVTFIFHIIIIMRWAKNKSTEERTIQTMYIWMQFPHLWYKINLELLTCHLNYYIVIYIIIQHHNIKDRRMNKRRMIKTQEGRHKKTSLEKYSPLTLLQGFERLACERMLETELKLHILTPLLWPSRCVFIVLLMLGSTQSGLSEGPLGLV